jgi:hypothetical protein
VNRHVVTTPNAEVVSYLQEVAPPVTFLIKSQQGMDAEWCAKTSARIWILHLARW